jgi:hypothetical protein
MPLALACALVMPSTGAAQERRRPAELTVNEFHARRDAGLVHIDAVLANTGERRAGSVIVVLQFLAPGRQTVSERESPLEEDSIEPGGEVPLSLETPFQPRVVEIRIAAKDRSGREIKVNRPGPYRIE